MRVAVAFCLILAAAAFAVHAISLPRQVFFERKSFPSEWKLVGFPASTDKFSFTLALKQQNLDVLDRTFWAVSTPGNPEYRNFLSREEILAIVSPSAHDRTIVKNFLHSQGVMDIVDRGDNIHCKSTVAVAEKLFKTSFYVFSHETKNVRIIRQMGEYSLPAYITKYVEMVSGVSEFPMIKKRAPRTPNVADAAVVPQTLSAVYNIPADASASNTSQGVIEFGAGEYFSPSSLQTFAKNVGLTIAPLESSHIISPEPPVGIEGTLDIQYIAAMGTDAANWYWTETNWLYDWSSSFFAAADVPNIVSLSYGWAEYDQCNPEISDECSVLGVNALQYVTRVNTEFQKVGTRGVSIIVASGDSGANGRTDGGCTDKILHPDYPAASPYVTSVGATQLETPEVKLANPPPVCKSSFQCASGGNETAVSYAFSQFTSGGGFSNFAAQPDYQTDAVKAYLSSGVALPPASYFNVSGRAYPDVAALGHNFVIYDLSEGGFVEVGGTSASAPSFAGMMSLANQVALAKDGKPLGFLNPFLYQMFAAQPNTFRDIIYGDNKCTEDGCSLSCKGFVAAKGWDPVTGLGVPDVTNILSYVSANL